MPRPQSSHWTIRVDESSGQVKHSVWRGDECVAADIASLADAQMISAAPELYEYARSLYGAASAPAGGEKAAHPATEEAPGGFAPWRSRGAGNGEVGLERAQAEMQTSYAKPDRQRPFDKTFQTALAQIERDAKASGLTLKKLAEEAQISRTQFARWRNQAPGTIQVMTKLQALVRSRRGRKD